MTQATWQSPPPFSAFEPASGHFLTESNREQYRQAYAAIQVSKSGIQLVQEKDPVLALAKIFGGLEAGATLALGNPDWPDSICAEVRQQLDGFPCPELSLEPELLIPTGGSSGGLIKLARHTWTSLATAALSLQAHLEGASINSLCVLPVYHVSGFMQAVRALVSGGMLHLAQSPQLESGNLPPQLHLAETCLSLVPTQLRRLIPGQLSLLQSFKMIFLGGAGFEPDELQELGQAKLPIALSYGMTETAAMVTLSSPEALENGDFTQGPPLPHVTLQLTEEDQVAIDSACLFRGYVAHPARAPGTPYLAGDRGRLDAAGRFQFLGRVDNLINTGGEKVDPQRVIQALKQRHEILDTWVGGIPDPDWGERVVAAVVIKAGQSLNMEQLRQELTHTLAPHEIPKSIQAFDSLPLNAVGKVDSESMRSRFTTD